MPTFSHSKIECFRNCPRQYFYRYIARVEVPDAPEQIATFLGSRCHDALEWLYRRVMTGAIPTRPELLAEFARVWDEKWTDDIEIQERGMTAALARSLAEKCVGDYFDAHHPFNDGATIDLEKEIRFTLDAEAGISMIGFIDRLAKDAEGVWHIHDYKTNKRLPSQADMDASPQLAYYEIGIRELWPTIERVQLHWHFLRFTETITSTRTPDQLEALKRDALATIAEVRSRGKAEDGFEPVESGLCDYCDYQSICPVRKHASKVDALPTNRYRSEPGVKLVNRWSKLKEAKAAAAEKVEEIDAEIAEVQEALIEYADREGVAVVVGDDHEASIKHDVKTIFPRKGQEPEEHANLERRLLESPFWDQVSSMDASMLRALWKEPKALDPKLWALLKKFVMQEEETKVKLRKRRER